VTSVVVATRNRVAVLGKMLEAFAGLESPHGEWELLVVDNGSVDGTQAMLAQWVAGARIPLRRLEEPRRGKSRALNVGIRSSRGETLAFTDDDAVVDRHWLHNLTRAVREHADCIGFGGRSIAVGFDGRPPRGHGIVNYDLGDHAFELPPFRDSPPGVNFFFRRRAFERYGLFREDLGPGTDVQRAEDTDFVRRLWLGGERMWYAADVVVRHPVDMGRLRKAHSLRWMFWVGRSNARMAGRPSGAPRIRGVPRYLLRSVAAAAAGFAIAPWRARTQGGFASLQRLAFDLGLLREFWALPATFEPGRAIPYLVDAGVGVATDASRSSSREAAPASGVGGAT
jgi:glycosyltransferase involved in cell wall biosynthesis